MNSSKNKLSVKASIIVPAFNAEKSIGNCIQALQKQTVKPLEIIVVNDGSTDNTAAQIGKFKGVKVISQENKGPAAARNLGAWNAKGEILIFTDSDCIAEKNFAEEMLKPFQDGKVVGVQGAYKTRQKELIARFDQLDIESRYERMKKTESIDFIGSYAAAFKREVFKRFGGFDESFKTASGEDTEFSFRLSKAGLKMQFNPRAIVWHSHPASLWKYFKVKANRSFWRFPIYKRHSEKTVRDAYTSQAIKIQLIIALAIALTLIAIVIAMLFFPQRAYTALIAFVIGVVAFIVSTLGFAKFAFKKDKTIALASPFFIAVRTLGFACGIVKGFFKWRMSIEIIKGFLSSLAKGK